MLSILLTCCAIAQSATNPAPSSDLHANVVKLVKLEGVRERMQALLPQSMKVAKEALAKMPGTSPEFIEEWTRRMTERMNLDDYVDASVKAYEVNLSNDEVLELFP
jgi:hypothetical protein